jgi:ATP-dependent Clp protease ATP-binding subunit ClpB
MADVASPEPLVEAAADGAGPDWLNDLSHSLAFHPQFVLSGNVRDLHLVPTSDGLMHVGTGEALWWLLEQRQYRYLLLYDPIDGLQVMKPREQAAWPPIQALQRLRDISSVRLPTPELVQLLRDVQPSATAPGLPGAIVIDYASRLSSPLAGPGAEIDELFSAALKLSHRAQPRGAPGRTPPPFNPIIWIADRANDLPDWFRIGNEAVRTLVLGLPDRAERQLIAERAARGFHDYHALTEDERKALTLQFVLLSEGMTLRGMYAVQELARTRHFGLQRIADAIRAYKVGSSDDPWKDESVRTSIRSADARIREKVKGQPQAIRQTLDILKRSVTGLTGAHAGRSGSRPRGVLFFAGPTGVGKTELAKQVTGILFGDESAYHRFDMSEFSAEHSEARLIGAPPGFVGHDAGGELVNAIRRKPFSVLLFDEIEKAHPRILDKFLQILEDGRLTDGRGDTVFFSEAVIIFTSNLGIYGEETRDGRPQRVQRVTAASALDQQAVETLVRPEIERHFRFELQRPELLNRIGDNVVVFDFIRAPVAREILDKMLANVVRRVAEEAGATLELAPMAQEVLLAEALAAAGENGGRGIGNRVETCLVNPLARALFEREGSVAGARLTVESLSQQDGVWEARLR